jgi:2-iminobutanoate/2-iminopropanoate deaminase
MSSTRKIVTPDAPQAIGPYSQAIVAGGWVYCSGQIPLDPRTGQLAGKDVAEQTERVLQNLSAVLKASGSDLSRVVKRR